jgi:enterochelin esterase-like enzyme
MRKHLKRRRSLLGRLSRVRGIARNDILDDADSKQGLKLVWFATGKEDFLLRTTEATVDMIKSHGFNVTYRETDGGHTWINWRDYLHEFAPLLFTEK